MTIFVARNSNIVPSEKSGLYTVYHDMPSRIERAIKNHLIHVYSRKRFFFVPTSILLPFSIIQGMKTDI